LAPGSKLGDPLINLRYGVVTMTLQHVLSGFQDFFPSNWHCERAIMQNSDLSTPLLR